MTNSNGGGWGGGSAKVTKSDDIFFNNPSFTDNKIDCLGEGGECEHDLLFFEIFSYSIEKTLARRRRENFSSKIKIVQGRHRPRSICEKIEAKIKIPYEANDLQNFPA